MDGGTRPIGLCCSGSKPEEGDTGVDKSNLKEMSGPNLDGMEFVSRKVKQNMASDRWT